jgi:hypothetical protein
MKTARAIFAALVLAALLTACGGSAPTATEPPVPTVIPPTATEPPTATKPPAPTQTPRILTIPDATGAIEITVPSSWSEYNGDLFDTGSIQFASVYASTSLTGFNDLSAPGVWVGASAQMDAMVGYVELLNTWNESYSNVCSYDSRMEYSDSKYEGQLDFFSGCNGNGDILLILVAQPKADPAGYLVTVLFNETDLTNTDFIGSLKSILDTFNVVGELPK